VSDFNNGFETDTPEDSGTGDGTAGKPETRLMYADPLEFFVEILGPSYVRDVNNGSEFAWCPEWYKHVEALARIETLWRAWEHLRQDGALGLSTWWLHHADPHMRILMATNGPFKRCAYEGHQGQERPDQFCLPHAAPEADSSTDCCHLA